MRTPLTIFYLAIVTLCSCTKIMDAPALKQKAESDILGIWTLEKRIDEIFDPVDTLKSTTIYNGTKDDFYNFQKDKFVSIGEAGKPVIKRSYSLMSSKRVFISTEDDALYWHMDLDGNHLKLYLWLNDITTYTGHRVTIYLKR